MYLTDICTVAVNLAGVPAISIPAGTDKQKLPIGFQLIAPQKQDAKLLAVTRAVEEVLA
jgi:aspartyl-tRNA(Asn)/glutamyl-tRNA(Gln) amidotransferase subunit A